MQTDTPERYGIWLLPDAEQVLLTHIDYDATAALRNVGFRSAAAREATVERGYPLAHEVRLSGPALIGFGYGFDRAVEIANALAASFGWGIAMDAAGEEVA